MKRILFALIAMMTSQAFAAPQLANLTDSQFEDLSKEMSSNFCHTAGLGASNLGDVFGFQVGIVGGLTTTPKLKEIIADSGGDMDNLMNAGIMAAVSVPFGFTFEAVSLPKMSSNGASIGTLSLGVKYKLNDLIPVLPVNLALRATHTTSDFKFDQAGVGSVENNNTITGVGLLISPMLPVVEPYAGVAMLNASNKLGSSVSSVFADSSPEKTKKVSGTQILAGVDVNLMLFKMGLEYSNAFNASKYSFKLAFGF